MRVVTNPGSNLTPEAVEHYSFEVAPQQIVAGDGSHDCRAPVALADVDRWIAASKEFPHVVGTTASEFASIFARVAREDPEVVAIMTSRKIIQSHASALAAAKVVEERAAFARARIAVVDSTVTDVGAGLVCLVAGEAARAGIPHSLAVQTLEAVASRTTMVLVVSTLENLVRGGRAGFLRAWLADALDLKPLIGFVDGALTGVGRISGKADRVVELASAVGRTVVKPKRVWVGIAHGGAPLDAVRLEEHVRRTLPVEYVYRQRLSASIYLHGGPGSLWHVRRTLPVEYVYRQRLSASIYLHGGPGSLWHVRRTLPVEYVYRQRLSASIYLHGGPGSLCLAVTQLDGLAWTPPVPPPFSEKV
jgi:DegV family protein with EDD domain